jgi:nucleotide-binding universal stress UspA family protein
MFDSMLFPTDGSDEADRALGFVLDIAAAHDATVHILSVADTNTRSVASSDSGLVDVLAEECERVVRDAGEQARSRDISVIETAVRGEPYSTITEYATDHGINLIAMSTKGRSAFGRFILGSVATKVIRTTDVPVLTMRPEATAAHPFSDVLVATDGSTSAEAGLNEAVGLAAAESATLHAVSVVELGSYGPDAHASLNIETFEQRAEDAVSVASQVGAEANVDVRTMVDFGEVHAKILQAIETMDVDIVVLGTHGRTGFDRYLLGSIAEKVVRTSPIPVLTVREPNGESER